MENIKKYELFVNLLEDEKIYMDPGLTFRTVCGWIGVEPESLERDIYSEVGMRGEEVLKMYRDSLPQHFLNKYGIVL